MATYEVSTWSELVTELSTNRSETKTIKLVDDIDCNGVAPQGIDTTINCYCSHTYPVTIDGEYEENGITKRHEIRNLRTNVTSPVSIFKLVPNNSSVFEIKIKGIDFINLIFLDVNFFDMVASWSSQNNHIYLENCRFVGKRNKPFVVRYGWQNNNNTIELESCFFNIPYLSANPNKNDVPLFGDWFNSNNNNLLIFANFCHFRSNYDNWTVTGAETPLQFIKLNGCYVDGVIVGQTNLQIAAYDYESAMQNVIDADIFLKQPQSSTSPTIYAPKGIWRNDVKKWDDTTVMVETTNGNASAIPCTPAEMISPSVLAAKGFDVVVPNT